MGFLLAEVSIENENFSQAVDDFTSCLEIRRNLLPSDLRLIAETLYQLGLAQEYHQQYDEAVGSLNSAIDMLKKHIANLSADEEAAAPISSNLIKKKDNPEEGQ